MSAIKLLNTLALSTLAILLLSFAPSQSLAVSIQPNHLARQVPNHHGITKKKKRDTTRCKPKSSSSAPEPTSTPSQAGPPKVDASLPTSGSPGNAVTNPQNTGSGPKKFAVAWGMGEDPRINLFKNHAVMIHLWDSWIPQVVKDSGIPFSIMLHDAKQETLEKFNGVVQQDYTGTTHVFGFNEINDENQANLPVDQAIKYWKEYLEPLASKGYTLASPSVTSAPDSINLIRAFNDGCTGCHIDEIAIHWYGTVAEEFESYVNLWASFNKPIRVTEFACHDFTSPNQPDMGKVWEFTEKAINFLEADGRVASYATFGFFDNMPGGVGDNNRLFIKDGGLSELGGRYVYGK